MMSMPPVERNWVRAEGIESNRDLLMSLEPEQHGPLRVVSTGPLAIQAADLRALGEMRYLVDVAVEDGRLVFHFAIPVGAHRALRQVTRNGVTRSVRAESQEVMV